MHTAQESNLCNMPAVNKAPYGEAVAVQARRPVRVEEEGDGRGAAILLAQVRA